MQALTYILVTVVIIGLCGLAMSVGLIIRNKTFTSCGRAARDYDGKQIRCAACGDTDEADGTSCKRERDRAATRP